MKAIVVRILLSILGIIMSLALMELGLKISNYPQNISPPDYLPGSSQRDEIIGWRHKPGTYFYTSPGSDKSAFRFTILSNGSRATSEQANLSKASIVLLGCSFVAGFGLDDRQTFAWHLQEQLPNQSIINLGVGAYGTLHSLIAFRRYLEGIITNDLPKIIIYGFADFHIFRNIKNPGMQRYWNTKGSFPYCDQQGCGVWEGKPMPGWYRSARVFSLIENYIDTQTISRQKQFAEEVTLKLIKEMQGLAEGKGIKFLVVPVSLEERSWIDRFNQNNIANFECDNPSLHKSQYRLVDGHPNELWNEKFAECLRKKIDALLVF